MAELRQAIHSVPIDASKITSRWAAQGFVPVMGMIFHEGGNNSRSNLVNLRISVVAATDVQYTAQDPLLRIVVKVGQRQHQTSTKTGFNPTWNETFSFEAVPTDMVTFRVQDQGQGNFGEAVLPVGDLPIHQGPVEKWIPVSVGGRVTAQLRIMFELSKASQITYSSFVPNFDQHRPWNTYAVGNERRLWNNVLVPYTTVLTLVAGDVEFTVGDRHYPLRPGDELVIPSKTVYSAVSRGVDSTWLYAFRFGSEAATTPQVIHQGHNSLQLRVLVVEATDIMGLHHGLPDPKITIITGNQQWDTTVQRSSLHPVWNENHIFNVNPGSFLNFRLQDTSYNSEIIGEASLPVEDLNLREMEVEKWIPLTRQGRAAAHLRVMFRLMHSPQTNTYHVSPHSNYLYQ